MILYGECYGRVTKELYIKIPDSYDINGDPVYGGTTTVKVVSLGELECGSSDAGDTETISPCRMDVEIQFSGTTAAMEAAHLKLLADVAPGCVAYIARRDVAANLIYGFIDNAGVEADYVKKTISLTLVDRTMPLSYTFGTDSDTWDTLPNILKGVATARDLAITNPYSSVNIITEAKLKLSGSAEEIVLSGLLLNYTYLVDNRRSLPWTDYAGAFKAIMANVLSYPLIDINGSLYVLPLYCQAAAASYPMMDRARIIKDSFEVKTNSTYFTKFTANRAVAFTNPAVTYREEFYDLGLAGAKKENVKSVVMPFVCDNTDNGAFASGLDSGNVAHDIATDGISFKIPAGWSAYDNFEDNYRTLVIPAGVYREVTVKISGLDFPINLYRLPYVSGVYRPIGIRYDVVKATTEIFFVEAKA